MLKHIVAALAFLVAPALTHAAGLNLVEAGKLTWGDSPTFVPFEFLKDGKPVGFDVDLLAELAKRSGLTSNIMVMEFKGVIPALLGKRVDAGVSGLYITAERLKVADFVPYVRIGDQIVVQKGNPKKITGRTGLCGFKVAVPVTTAFEASAKKESAACTAAGKPAIDILSLPGSTDAALALQQKRVDAVLNSNATIAAMMSQNPGAYELAGEPFDTNTRVGIALRKGDTALKAKLSEALQSMHKDGTYAALLKKWNLPAQASIF